MEKILTVEDLRRKASNVKHEMDSLEKAAYGMTFEELIRLLSGNKEEGEKNCQEKKLDTEIA